MSQFGSWCSSWARTPNRCGIALFVGMALCLLLGVGRGRAAAQVERRAVLVASWSECPVRQPLARAPIQPVVATAKVDSRMRERVLNAAGAVERS